MGVGANQRAKVSLARDTWLLHNLDVVATAEWVADQLPSDLSPSLLPPSLPLPLSSLTLWQGQRVEVILVVVARQRKAEQL